jgi:hypothetical protein
MMLHRFARKYSTHDITKEYRCIPVCPLLHGWAVADDAWAANIGGITCPDWTKVFCFTSTREFSRPSLTPWFRAWLARCLGLPDYRFCLFVRSAEEEKGGGSWQLHPWSRIAEGI